MIHKKWFKRAWTAVITLFLYVQIFPPIAAIAAGIVPDYAWSLSLQPEIGTVEVGEELSLVTAIQNTGEQTWTAENVDFQLQWVNESQEVINSSNKDLETEVSLGDEINLNWQTIAPTEPGNYDLHFGLVVNGLLIDSSINSFPVTINASSQLPESPEPTTPVEFNYIPEIITAVDLEALLGDYAIVDVTLKNTGTETGFSPTFKLELPTEISFLESLPLNAEVDQIPPTTVSSQDEQTVVVWQNLPEIPAGQSLEFKLKLAVAGSDKLHLGQIVQLKLTGTFYDADLSPASANSVEHNFGLEVKPYRVTTPSSSEQLVGEQFQQEVQIQNNAEIDSALPVIIRQILEAGLKYVPNSENVINAIVQRFQVIENPDGTTILEWTFEELRKENYALPVIITYLVEVAKAISDSPIAQNQEVGIKSEVEAAYQTNPQSSESEPQTFNIEKVNKVQAKYLSVSKVPDKTIVIPGDQVTYTVTITSSAAYAFNSIRIADVVSNGLIFQSSSLPLVENYPQGKDLAWTIADLPAGGEVQFTYTVLVSQFYTDSQEILANDQFKSLLQVNAIWGDVTEIGVTGDTNEYVGANLQTPEPQMTNTIWDATNNTWVTDLNIVPGDEFVQRVRINFPANTDTKSANLEFKLPVGISNQGIEIAVSDLNVFSNDPVNYTLNNGEFSINLGDVQAGAFWEIKMQNLLEDWPGIVLGQELSTVAQLTYINTNKPEENTPSIQDYKYAESSVHVAEPKLEASKRLVSGYLAAGEYVTVESVIKNTGNATAYNVNVLDTIPANAVLVLESLVTEGCYPDVNDDSLGITDCVLAAGQEVKFTYQLIIGADVITATPIDSQIIIGSYQNRFIESESPIRDYSGRTYNFNWKGLEGALVTNAFIRELPSLNQIPAIGRNREFELVFSVKNVGESPVYATKSFVDARLANPQISFLSKYSEPFGYVAANVNGEDFWQIGQLNPGDNVNLVYKFRSTPELELGLNFTPSIRAEAENAAVNLIRKDASAELPADVDADDQTIAQFTTARLDSIAPLGFIKFFNQANQQITATNFPDIYVEYSANDIAELLNTPAGIYAVRFTRDRDTYNGNGNNWTVLPGLQVTDKCADAWESCQRWDGKAIKIPVSLETVEGRQTFFMQVVDVDGNVKKVERSIVFDTTAPDSGNVLIGHYQFDTANPQFTGSPTNFVTYKVSDSEQNSNFSSGVNAVRFSLNDRPFGDWRNYIDNQERSEVFSWVDLLPVAGSQLKVSLQLRDAAGNISNPTSIVISDGITYLPSIPELSVVINDGETHTRENLVEVKLDALAAPALNIQQVQYIYCLNIDDCNIQFEQNNWDSLRTFSPVQQVFLPRGDLAGQKFICARVQDNANNYSSPACDSIIQDFVAPTGSIQINAGAISTPSSQVVLTLQATDPAHTDNSSGIGQIEYALSQDGLFWSAWTPLTTDPTQVDYLLFTDMGEARVLVRYRDGLGNQSINFSDDIEINPFMTNGGIVINDDATFTNTETVTLKLSPTGTPDTMRVWNQGADAYHLAVEPYQEFKHWNLPAGFGPKRVYVQYFYSNQASEPVYDEIILAPEYAVEYRQTSTAANEFTLGNFPNQALASDFVNFVASVRNVGSLNWTVGEVNLSYHWYRADGSIYQFEGSRGLLNHQVGYLDADDNVRLQIMTPVVPGAYILRIDMVHEGHTWFSAMGNKSPGFNVQVLENPEYPAPQNQPTVLGEYDGEYGIGGTSFYIVQPGRPGTDWRCEGYDCYSGIAEEYYQCSARGISNFTDTNETNPDRFKNECWWPIYEANRHLYDGVTLPPEFVFKPWNFLQPGWQLIIPNAPDTWRADLVGISHDAQITVKQGENVLVEASYTNSGTATWQNSYVRLATANPDDRASQFAASWLAANRTGTYAENAEILPQGLASFRFEITAGQDLAPGTYRECFRPVADVVPETSSPDQLIRMSDQQACWDVRVIPRFLKSGNIFCTVGTGLYNAINGQQVGTLPYNSNVIIQEEVGAWGRISLEQNGQLQTYWIQLNCFQQTGTVENNEQTSSDVAYNQPTGDTGIVISTVGVKLRFGPSLQFRWDVEVPYGTEVRVLRRTAPGNDGLPGWYEIELPDGRRGWVPAGYIDLAPGYNPAIWAPPQPAFRESHICNAYTTEMKFSPNWGSRTIENITVDSNVRIIDIVGEWYYVSRLSGKSGYVHQSYVCEGFKVNPYDFGNNGQSLAQVNGINFNRPYNIAAQITSGFGPRQGSFHYGTDYGLSCGTDVFAVAVGKVSALGTNGIVEGNASTPNTPSNYIIIDHGAGWQSYYWHLNSVSVEVNQEVTMGQFIGKSGNTGWVIGDPLAAKENQGCHLHFELRKNGIATDPEWVFAQKPRVLGNWSPLPGSEDRNDFIAGVPGADLNDPYGGEIYRGAWPELTYDRFIRYDGAVKWNQIKQAETTGPQAPQITLTKTADDGASVTIYGTAIPKNSPIHVRLWNEYRHCTLCGSSWEYRYQQGSAQHVFLKIQKVDGTYLGGLWNDSPDGRWQLTLPLGGNLNVNDVVQAQVQIYSDFHFGGLQWWVNDFGDSTTISANPLASSWSNNVLIPARWIPDPAEQAFLMREGELGNALRDGVVHEWCGYKVLDYSRIGNYGDSLLMYNPNHNRAYVISGGIWWSYYTYGGCGEFGLPVMDEANTGGQPGWYQNFERANIYWSQSHQKSQPGIVKGEIRNYYESLGGTWSYLGFPEGKEWGETSSCAVSGTLQHFQHGKVFSSSLGNVDIGYGVWFHRQNSVGGISKTGWPLGKPYNISGSWWQWGFERGVLNANFTEWFDDQGCGRFDARNNDPDNEFARIIQLKEDRDFANFKRTTGDLGKVHVWNCGSQSIWLADYDEIITREGKLLGSSWVMVSSGNAFVVTGSVKDYYARNNGCERFGVPVIDTMENDISKHDEIYDWQAFERGSVFLEPIWAVKSYEVLGCINNVYSQNIGSANYLKSMLGGPVDNLRMHYGLNIGDQETDIQGQEFQGGYIVQLGQECNYVLHSWAQNQLIQELSGEQPNVIQLFTEGFIEGIKLQIPKTAGDIALIIGQVVASAISGFGAVLLAIQLTIAVVNLLQNIDLVTSSVIEFFGAVAGGVVYVAGLIGAIVLGGAVMNKLASTVGSQFVGLVSKLGLYGPRIKALANAGVSITSDFRNSIMKLSSTTGVSHFADELVEGAEQNATFISRIKGIIDPSKLNADQIDNIIYLAKNDIDVSVDDFAKLKISGSLKNTKKDYISEILERASKGEVIDVHVFTRIKYWSNIANEVITDQAKYIEDVIADTKNFIIGTDGIILGTGRPSHLKTMHIDISDGDLQVRAINRPNEYMTKFYSMDLAEQTIVSVLDRNKIRLLEWSATAKAGDRLRNLPDSTFNFPVGYGYLYDSKLLAKFENLNRVTVSFEKLANGAFIPVTGFTPVR